VVGVCGGWASTTVDREALALTRTVGMLAACLLRDASTRTPTTV